MQAMLFGRDVEKPEADLVLCEASKNRDLVQAMSREKILNVLGQLSELWREGGEFRNAYWATDPVAGTGFSREMIYVGLDSLVSALDRDCLRSRVESQLGAEAFDDGAIGRGLHAMPLGVVLHVVSAIPFHGAAQALIAGMLTKNVNLVKSSAANHEFLRLFAASIDRCCPKLSAAVAVLPWSGGDQDFERALAAGVDGILVAGSGDTVSRYRAYAAPTAELIEFGPRASIAVVSAAGRPLLDLSDLALDISLWGQQVCTAPQCVYVEGETAAQELAGELSGALADLSSVLPPGTASLDDRIEVGQVRDLARFREALGKGELHVPGPLDTVIYEQKTRFEASPLNRCVRVMPYDSLAEVTASLVPLRGFIQTVGLAVHTDERQQYLGALASCGVRRIAGIGRMSCPSPSALHDGIMECQRLVRWIEVEEV